MDKKKKTVNVWYDGEGDFLEVIFEKKKGHFRKTLVPAVMEKIDAKGNVIGFSILKVSSHAVGKPLSFKLKS